MSNGLIYNTESIDTIRKHNDELLIAVDNAISKLVRIPPEKRNTSISRMIDYWRHCRSALRWSTRQAEQRYRSVDNAK